MEYEHSHAMMTSFQETQDMLRRPHVRMRPAVYKDGNLWCCLYGGNIQTGVCGWGATPDMACADFDRTWWNGDIKECAGAIKSKKEGQS